MLFNSFFSFFYCIKRTSWFTWILSLSVLISIEFSSVSNKSKYNDIESKFDKIRRKLSYELDREIKSSEVMPLILEKAYVTSKTIQHKPRKVNLQLIQEELSKGTTTKKCAEKFGVSIQTVFRYKAKLREMNY